MTITTELVADQPRRMPPPLIEEEAVSGSRDWVHQSACAKPYAENRYDAWFGPAEDDPAFKGTVIPKEYRKVAMRTCLVCPVKQECLDYAMKNDIRQGIWGGKAPEDRTKLRNARAARAAEREEVTS